MEHFSLVDMGRSFEFLKSQMIEGVEGVLRIDSGNPGPVLGITVHTHGNEPSGLATVQFLIEEFGIKDKILCGTLYLVINNIEATERYLAATTDEQRRLTRKVDVNMNRLPRELETLSGDTRSEIKRALQLLPIWRQFSVGFDIHSMQIEFPPMIMSVGTGLHMNLIRGFPIRIICSNIDTIHPETLAACRFYGTGSDIQILAIESGQHEKKEAFENARTCALALLRNLKMIEGKETSTIAEFFEEYRVKDAITFRDTTFELSDHLCKPFEQFRSVKKGEILACSDDGKRAFLAPFDGHTLLHVRRRPDDITEQAVFLSQPVKTIRL